MITITNNMQNIILKLVHLCQVTRTHLQSIHGNNYQ